MIRDTDLFGDPVPPPAVYRKDVGILRGEQIVASRTEEEIFSALGLRVIPPEDRER